MMKPHTNNIDLLLLNGTAQTMDTKTPQAQAIAIKSKLILAIGKNDMLSAMADSSTEIIDLKRRLVLPGMMDSHFHFYDWAMGRRQLVLANETSLEQLLLKVGATARTIPAHAAPQRSLHVVR